MVAMRLLSTGSLSVRLGAQAGNGLHQLGASVADDARRTWTVREHVLAALNLAGFVTGEFLKQSPPSNAIVFFNLGLTYRF